MRGQRAQRGPALQQARRQGRADAAECVQTIMVGREPGYYAEPVQEPLPGGNVTPLEVLGRHPREVVGGLAVGTLDEPA